MKFNCPVFKRRMEKSNKKNFKEKKACITWKDNDLDSSSDSENEIINLGLIAKDYESGEKVISSNYDLSIFFMNFKMHSMICIKNLSNLSN